jgi:hypothetical protein
MQISQRSCANRVAPLPFCQTSGPSKPPSPSHFLPLITALKPLPSGQLIVKQNKKIIKWNCFQKVQQGREKQNNKSSSNLQS